MKNEPLMESDFTHRNPGSTELQPWCYVDNSQSMEKNIEHCDIPKCSEKMWLYIIVSFVGVATIIIIVVSICCCKKYKKRGMTNIQNVSVLIFVTSSSTKF